jgi:hypothetical protein
MNLRNVAFEMPMRSSRTDSHVASIYWRLERIREQVGLRRMSDPSQIGLAALFWSLTDEEARSKIRAQQVYAR